MTREADLLIRDLLDHHGTSFARELGLDLTRNDASTLFRWLCAALLMSAPIPQSGALGAARALAEAGWTTAQRLLESSWQERVEVLDRAGHARFDESTARMLAETARLLLQEYEGDLRKLRAAARGDPGRQRELLKGFKGIGDVGADIFLREMQAVWTEHFPFLDDRARAAARRLRLPADPTALAGTLGPPDLAALASALVRADLGGVGRDQLLAQALEHEALEREAMDRQATERST